MVSLSAAIMLAAFSGTGQSVLLDFYSDSCGPCRMMDPVVKQLAAQGYPVRQVNIQQDPALAVHFGVTRIPCFVMLVDGREVERLEGLTSGQRLTQTSARAGAEHAAGARRAGPEQPAGPAPGQRAGLLFRRRRRLRPGRRHAGDDGPARRGRTGLLR